MRGMLASCAKANVAITESDKAIKIFFIFMLIAVCFQIDWGQNYKKQGKNKWRSKIFDEKIKAAKENFINIEYDNLKWTNKH